MSHPFGDLLSKHLHRKHGLSQAKLAAGIMQAPAIVTWMCKGERLTGRQARERVLAVIAWLHANDALETAGEANELLTVAGMSALRVSELAEAALLRQLNGLPASPLSPATYPSLEKSPRYPVSEYSLIGRQAEWTAMQSAWHNATQGGAHLVCVTGEPGIGKTRLAEELIVNAQRQGHIAVYARAYALEGRLAYAPVGDWLRSTALATRVRKLDAVWRTEIARLLPELLIADPALPAPQPLTERWQLKRLFESLLQVFSAETHSMPVLLVLDDMQWCDPETLDWLQYLISAAPWLKLLIVGTVRDTEVDAGHPLRKLWHNLLQAGQLTILALNPLERAETASLGAEVARQPLDVLVANQLHDDCAGNPLFVIETVRAQHGPQRAGTAATGQHDDPAFLPSKVSAVIQARLARLSPHAHAIAGLAAVIGRAFTLQLVTQSSGHSDEDVAQAMDELHRHRLLRSQGGAYYDLSHDRIRDVVYMELSPVRRGLLHRAVARTLETIHADELDVVAGELAGHFQQAGASDQALAYLRRAARVAQRLYAHSKVIRYLEKAIAVIQMEPDSHKSRLLELDLWSELGDARLWVHGYGSEPVGEAWSRANALAMQTGTVLQRAITLQKLAGLQSNRGEWQKCREHILQALSLAESSGDPFQISISLKIFGHCLFHAGELESSLDYYQRAVMLAAKPAQISESRKWNNLRSSLQTRMALSLWMLGYPDQAQNTTDRALEDIHARLNINDQFGPVEFCAHLFSYIRDVDRVSRLGEKLIEMSGTYDFSFFHCSGQFFKGWALAQTGSAKAGALLAREGLNGLQRHGSRMMEPYTRALVAESLALAGEHRKAIGEVDAGIAFANEKCNVYWNAHLLTLKGDFLQALAAPDSDVEAWYVRAKTLAHSQHARSLELRATIGLARLWQKQNRTSEAFEILAGIYNWFTEGFETPDLKDARTLLAECGETQFWRK